jgi:hypothetical protein
VGVGVWFSDGGRPHCEERRALWGRERITATSGRRQFEEENGKKTKNGTT